MSRKYSKLFLLFVLFKKTFYLSAVFLKNIHTRAARAPPISGATINTHTFDNASPPAKRAGPRDLAGLTLVPVK